MNPQKCLEATIVVHRASFKAIELVGQNDHKGPISGAKGDSLYKYTKQPYSITMCYSGVILRKFGTAYFSFHRTIFSLSLKHLPHKLSNNFEAHSLETKNFVDMRAKGAENCWFMLLGSS